MNDDIRYTKKGSVWGINPYATLNWRGLTLIGEFFLQQAEDQGPVQRQQTGPARARRAIRPSKTIRLIRARRTIKAHGAAAGRLPDAFRRLSEGAEADRQGLQLQQAPPVFLHAGGAQAGAAPGQAVQQGRPPGVPGRHGGRDRGRDGSLPFLDRQAVQEGADLIL